MRKIAVFIASLYIIVSIAFLDKPQLTQAVTALLAIVFILSRVETASLRIPTGAMTALILYGAWTGFTLIWTPDLQIGFYVAWRLLVNILFALIVYNVIATEDDVAILAQGYVIGALIVFFQLYNNVRHGKGYSGAEAVGQFRYSSDAMQPNGVAWVLAFAAGFSWLIISWNHKSTKPFTLLNYAMPVIAIVGTLYTGSRSGFVALAVVLIPLAVYIWKKPIGATLIGLCLFMMIPATLASQQIQGSLLRIMSLGSSRETDQFSGRLDLWQAAIEISLKRPFLGTGLGGYRAESAEMALNTTSGVTGAHQAFLDVLCQTGFIGLVFFVYFCYQMYLIAKRLPNQIRLIGFGLLGAISCVLLGAHEQNSTLVLMPVTLLIGVGLVARKSEMLSKSVQKVTSRVPMTESKAHG